MTESRTGRPLRSLGVAAVAVSLFIVQSLSGKLENLVAGSFSYCTIDPDNAFAWQSVHHLVMLAVALAIIAVLGSLLKVDFGLGAGVRKAGVRYLAIFTSAFAGFALVTHIIMLLGGRLPAYDFPLNTRNILGTLGFQLFLSGPAEELLYRALPISLLLYASGSKAKPGSTVTPEIIIASILFALAHIRWSLSPFTVSLDYMQLLYAMGMGVIQGVAYQKSRSVLYPILIHSLSNLIMVGMGYLFILLA